MSSNEQPQEQTVYALDVDGAHADRYLALRDYAGARESMIRRCDLAQGRSPLSSGKSGGS